MDLDPSDLLLFARIVECGSFSRAAVRVDLPKSTVSRRIALLEAKLGERLLQRTTRKLVLTEFGASLLEHASKVAEETEAAVALARHRQLAPSGRLRISMPADFANLSMGQVLAAFISRYPAISLELDLSPRRVDLLAENFDLAIRMGELPDDASLAARRVAFSTLGLYAAPSYLGVRGLPEHPDELFRHDLLSLPPTTNGLSRWVLLRGKTRWTRDLPTRLLANSPELLVRMACTGVGIAASTERFAAAYLASGELVRVLPEWCFPTVNGWAVFPGRRLMPAKTRAFLDIMEEMYDAGAGA
ncbi:LysR family transcriptional regulator [Janthinobacterium fluminis]|uniref:LysR family transcriptional regulator n=1 Tax=Janthinobacterium fluminis TaxID=2987524 RepID=A0ABT5K562_9BURK|nr:LysR family transcriptional regulator [Janthinobacterium fluminis]MDC8760019.1 LysR family transcriptional regulator [Janthinobacterium fluminis]